MSWQGWWCGQSSFLSGYFEEMSFTNLENLNVFFLQTRSFWWMHSISGDVWTFKWQLPGQKEGWGVRRGLECHVGWWLRIDRDGKDYYQGLCYNPEEVQAPMENSTFVCQCVSSLRTPLFAWRLCTLLCLAPARHHHLYKSVASALSGQGGYGVGSCFGYLCPHTCQAFHLLSPKVALITKLQLL